MTTSNLPAIRESSPLADGITVNIRQADRQYHLRIWVQGASVEDSLHPTPSAAVAALARIIADRMGGEQAIFRALLQELAGF